MNRLANSGEEFLQKVKAKGKDLKQIAQNLPDVKGKILNGDDKFTASKEKVPEADVKVRNRIEKLNLVNLQKLLNITNKRKIN